MTDSVGPPETTPSPVGGVVAFAAVAVVAVAVGSVFDIVGLVVPTVLGGVALWLAIRWHVGDETLQNRVGTGGDDLRDHTARTVLATESVVGLTLGTAIGLLICPAAYAVLYVGGSAVTVEILVTAAVSTVVLAGTLGSPADDSRSPGIQQVLGGTFDKLVGVTVVGLVTVGAFGALGLILAGSTVVFVETTTLLSSGYGGLEDLELLLVLQLLVLAVVLVIPRAVGTATEILHGGRRNLPAAVAWLDELPGAISTWYWGVLGAQLVLVLSGIEVPVLSAFTAVSGTVGTVVTMLLGTVVPLALLAVLGVAGAVVLGGFFYNFLVESDSAGPVVTRLVAAHVPMTVAVAFLLRPLPSSNVPFRLFRIVIGVVLLSHAFSLCLYALVAFAKREPVFDHATWYGYASVLTLSLAFAAYLKSATPLLVYVALAAGLLVWYVGETATELGEQLGRTADTASGEATHAVALGAVLAVAVAVVSVVSYGVSLPTDILGDTRSVAAVVLLSVAALAVIAREAAFGGTDWE